MGDLFHEDVPDNFKYETYRAMILNKQNTYLVLTKRPYKMAKFLSPETCFTRPLFDHIWHGLTVCNQQEADEKIPIFLQVPGKKFLSIEPMLGAIDLTRIMPTQNIESLLTGCMHKNYPVNCLIGGKNSVPWNINAVILGGETGPEARPLHPDWVRSVRDQCQSAGVPFFFKGWGEWIVATNVALIIHKKQWDSDRKDCCFLDIDGTMKSNSISMSQDAYAMIRVGRNKAGRELDGREWNQVPFLYVKHWNLLL